MILIEHLLKENKKYQNEKTGNKCRKATVRNMFINGKIKKFPEFDSFFNCNISKFVNYIIKPENNWPKFLSFFFWSKEKKAEK